MKKNNLTVQEVQHVSHVLAKEFMAWDEPIPEFATRYSHTLESCIAQPFQTINGKQAYPSLKSKGAILFYLMVKNHPFKNGNKRIAITTLLYFLSKHNKWLKIDNQELYNFAKFVAKSPAKFKNGMVLIIEEFIKSYLSDLKK